MYRDKEQVQREDYGNASFQYHNIQEHEEEEEGSSLLRGDHRKRDSIHLDIDRSHCNCREGTAFTGSQERKKRVSILLSDEMMLDGYPSLLILGKETEEQNNSHHSAITSVLKRTYKERELGQSLTIDMLNMGHQR